MAFTDDFTGSDGDLLQNRTGWSLVTDGAYTAQVKTNTITFFSGGGGSGFSVWTNTDQGSANQYIIVTEKRFSTETAVYAALRLVDKDNFIAYHLAGTGAAGARLCNMVGASLTDSIITWQGAADQQIKIEANGNTISVYTWNGSDWALVDSTTITDHSTETSAGFVANELVAGPAIKFDDWENGALGGGGTTIPVMMHHYASMRH